MATILRNIDDIRNSIDRYKLENYIKTDSKAIHSMINTYFTKSDLLKESEEENKRLHEELYSVKELQENLSKALIPFIK